MGLVTQSFPHNCNVDYVREDYDTAPKKGITFFDEAYLSTDLLYF